MFIDSRMPEEISRSSSGGPSFRTEVLQNASGFDDRNAQWANPLNNYDAAYAVKSWDELYTILEVHAAAQGQLNSFRWLDRLDSVSGRPLSTPTNTDAQLGVADGIQDTYQVVKNYTFGSITVEKIILLPIQGTLLVAINGAPKVEGPDYTVNYLGGIITFTSPPIGGDIITAGFEYDVPVRFATDQISNVLQSYNIGQATIPLIEVKRLD